MAAPLFLLAPPRSYTSLVNAMIGQHPEAFGFPELCLFIVDKLKEMWMSPADGIESQPTWAIHGFLRAVAEIYAGEQSTAAITMAHHWAIAREEKSIAAVYQELVAKIDPLISVEKSPIYTTSLKSMLAIREAFPDARFLHLVRHPVSQCKSVMSLNDGTFAKYVNSIEFIDNRAIVEPQLAWHDLNVNILDFLDSVPKELQMRMKGEDIIENPRHYLPIICRWLGIRDDNEAIDEMMHTERSPFACFGPFSALFGNDPAFLKGPALRPHKVKLPPLDMPVPWRNDNKGLRPEVIAMAQEFGYK